MLIISQFFAPTNIIAAVRFTKMVKFLARTGKYHFWVICIEPGENCIQDDLLRRDIASVAEYVTVIPIDVNKRFMGSIKKTVSHNKGGNAKAGIRGKNETNDIYVIVQEKLVNCQQGGILGKIKRQLGSMLLAANDMYDLIYEYCFALKAVKKMKQMPLGHMDVMVSTYGHIGAVILAHKMKRKNPRMGWIVDYRDPVTAPSWIMRKIINSIVRQADRKADYITGATKSCSGSGKELKKFHVISNGYDREDATGLCTGQNEKLTICYTGSLYYRKSDMSYAFKLISELSEEEEIDLGRISIVYAGEQFHLLKKQAEPYGLTGILVNRGAVSRKESLQIQGQSDILCALTWNNAGNDHILTGKVLEYFMMQKPIFAIVTGNKPGSMLKRIIEDADLGFCLEESETDEYYDAAKRWFLNQYREFISKGRLKFEPQMDKLEQYSSERMAQKFGILIEKC